MKFIAFLFLSFITITARSQDMPQQGSPHPADIYKVADGDTVYNKVDVEPSYPDGKPGWFRFVNKTLHYPMEAINNEIQGKVWARFIVDKQGKMSDLKIISGPEKGGLREEVLRVLSLSGAWVPATRDGRVVSAIKKQVLEFKMSTR